MATFCVQLDRALVQPARVQAEAERRSVPGQIEHWARLGRAALDNPDLPASFIAESLMGLAEPREDTMPFVARSGAVQPAKSPD